MSAELFHVIAQIIRRHIAEHGTVPVCTRYDTHERTFTEPMPFLFQNRYGSTQRGMSTTSEDAARGSRSVSTGPRGLAGVGFRLRRRRGSRSPGSCRRAS
jgi:hypothetical protein